MAANVTSNVIVNGHPNGPLNGPHTEDIYEGITERLGNMLCQRCHELKQLKVLPCQERHSFCEDCLDRAMIHRKCPSCMKGFAIPVGGVSGMASDVTHEQIKDVLDSLCQLRTTNCPVCALDENEAKLASKVYKYCREEKDLVCPKCVEQCERDLGLMDYNKVPESTDKDPSAPDEAPIPIKVVPVKVVPVPDTPLKELADVTENGYEPEAHEDKEKGHPKEGDHPMEGDHPKEEGHPKDTVVVNGDDKVSVTSSENTEEDAPDAMPLNTPHTSPLASPLASPSISASSSHEPINTPPPAYDDAESFEAPALPLKPPLAESDENVSCVDVPLLHNTWCHLGAPLSRANDVIFLPSDDSVVVADWYGGEVHRFSNTGEHTASRLLKNSPWSFVRERSKGPWSIAYSYSDDKIYVSEIGLASVCRMSPKDLSVDKKRIKLEGVQNPAGIAFLRNGQLVLTEDTFRGPHRVAIYDLNGKMIKDWQSSDPQLVCVDCHDRIVVSDHSNNRVEVYDTSGRLVTSFGDANTLRRPMGVATDRYGNIYVTHEIKSGYALSLWSAEGRRVAALQEWDHSHMTLTDRENWHMRSVDVHGNRLVLCGRRTLHGYALKGL